MAKTTVSPLKGKPQVYRATYDFADDGGTFGGGNEVDLFKLVAGTVIHKGWYEVETALASAGAATVEVGETGGDTDGIFDQKAYTVLAANYVSADADEGALLSATRKKYAAEQLVSLLIGTADLTAGRVHFFLECSHGF